MPYYFDCFRNALFLGDFDFFAGLGVASSGRFASSRSIGGISSTVIMSLSCVGEFSMSSESTSMFLVDSFNFRLASVFAARERLALDAKGSCSFSPLSSRLLCSGVSFRSLERFLPSPLVSVWSSSLPSFMNST